MGAPITWRNVDAPSQLEAARGFQNAQQSFGGVFDSVNAVMRQREAVANGNIAATEENNKQAYLDVLGNAKTPEELAALRASGQMESMRATLNSASRNATRSADEARLASLQQQSTTNTAFQDAATTRGELPVRQQITALIEANKLAEAQALADGSTIRDKAPLYKAIDDKTRTGVVRVREDEGYAQTAKLRPFALNAAQRNDTTGQMALDKAVLDQADAKSSRDLDDRADKAAAEYRSLTSGNKDVITREARFVGDSLGFKFPFNDDGSINADRMESGQKAAFEAHLAKNEMPSLASVSGGDTAAASAMIERFKSEGIYRPADLARAASNAASMFNTAPNSAIGNDLATKERNTRIAEAQEETDRDRYGVIATPGNQTGLQDAAFEMIDKMAPPGSSKNATYKNVVSRTLAEGGVKLKDANGNVVQRVLPSLSRIKLIIGAINPRYLTNDNNEIGEEFERWANSAEAQDGARLAITADASKKIRGVDKEPEAKKGK